MKWLPRKRTLLAIHRWLGVLAALFLIILSLTGLALNHAESLGLNRTMVSNPWVLGRYGMTNPKGLESYQLPGSRTVSWLEGDLYLNGQFVVDAGKPVGGYSGTQLQVIVTNEEILLVSPDGELIEKIPVEALPMDSITGLGLSAAGEPVVLSGSLGWVADPNWLEFSAMEEAVQGIPLQAVEIEPRVQEAIYQHRRGSGVSLHRFLLDLHSGRLFGWEGRTIMDLTAVSILVLALTGITGWLRKSSWGRRQRR